MEISLGGEITGTSESELCEKAGESSTNFVLWRGVESVFEGTPLGVFCKKFEPRKLTLFINAFSVNRDSWSRRLLCFASATAKGNKADDKIVGLPCFLYEGQNTFK